MCVGFYLFCCIFAVDFNKMQHNEETLTHSGGSYVWSYGHGTENAKT